MTGTQIKIIIILAIITIIAAFNNIFIGLGMIIVLGITGNIFRIYNSYKRAEIEKNVYNEIKNNKNQN